MKSVFNFTNIKKPKEEKKMEFEDLKVGDKYKFIDPNLKCCEYLELVKLPSGYDNSRGLIECVDENKIVHHYFTDEFLEKFQLIEEKKISTQQINNGKKHDQEKLQWDILLEMNALEVVAEVLQYGAKKYALRNYQNVKGWRWRYINAAFRHIFAYMRGEKIDNESGFHHIGHAIASLLMLLDNEINGMPDGDQR